VDSKAKYLALYSTRTCNYKYGAEPNLRPPGAPNPTGNTI